MCDTGLRGLPVWDTRAFVLAYPVCARSRPPPPPSCPGPPLEPYWGGLCDRPHPFGRQHHLTVVGQFSKAVHFIPLPKLPSAVGTAELLVLHMVRLHEIPSNIVSDHGPQFSSQLWKAFCHSPGASANLSSSYHPPRHPPSDKRPDRESQSGPGSCLAMRDLPQPCFRELAPPLGLICP